MNSPSGTTTRAPAGSEAATRPTNEETWPAAATAVAGTPASRANASRLRRTSSSKATAFVLPAAQSSIAAARASRVAGAGRPSVALSR